MKEKEGCSLRSRMRQASGKKCPQGEGRAALENESGLQTAQPQPSVASALSQACGQSRAMEAWKTPSRSGWVAEGTTSL